MADLSDSSLDFLRCLDSDPEQAWRGFFAYTWKILTIAPPIVLRNLDPAEREDVISDTILHCCGDNFRVLRLYRGDGRKFSGWLVFVTRNLVIDRLRKKLKHPTEPLPEEPNAAAAIDPHGGYEAKQVLDAVRRCMTDLSETCRLLLHFGSMDLPPRKIAVLMGWPADWNKKASDDLRACRERLRKRLVDSGIDPDNLPRRTERSKK